MLTDTTIDRVAPNRHRAIGLVLGAAIVAAIPGFLLVVIVGFVAGSVAGGLIIGILVALVVGLAITIPAWRGAEARILMLLDVRPVDGAAHARLVNLVEGLCTAAGLPRPQLFIVESPAANALTFGRDPRRGCVVVTEGLLGKLSRIELEGVLAHELCHLRMGGTLPVTMALSLCGRAGGGALAPVATHLAGAAVDKNREALADLEAVSLTRYPPGLLSALERLAEDPDGAALLAPAATAALWTVPLHIPGPPRDGATGGRGRHAAGLAERIQALREL